MCSLSLKDMVLCLFIHPTLTSGCLCSFSLFMGGSWASGLGSWERGERFRIQNFWSIKVNVGWNYQVLSWFIGTLRGDTVVQNGPKPLFIWDFGIWMYLNGYDLENSKNMLLHHSDDLLPWKQSKMATKHNYLKSLKLQNHCMQIVFFSQLVQT